MRVHRFAPTLAAFAALTAVCVSDQAQAQTSQQGRSSDAPFTTNPSRTSLGDDGRPLTQPMSPPINSTNSDRFRDVPDNQDRDRVPPVNPLDVLRGTQDLARPPAGGFVPTGPSIPSTTPNPGLSDQIQRLGKDVPSDVPPPPITPTTTDDGICKVKSGGGWFQPVQGVWQDDSRFPQVTFAESGPPSPNPQLEASGVGALTAKLPMVARRDTVLMGVERYRSAGRTVSAGTRDVIVLEGIGNCTKYVPVRVRFRYYSGAISQDIYTSEVVGDAPLAGRPLPYDRKFGVELRAALGVPPLPRVPFQMYGGSNYTIVAELIGPDNLGTGIAVRVSGPLEEMHPPVVEFVPLMLSFDTMSKQDEEKFAGFVASLADASHRFIPDYFPLVREGLPTFARGVLNLADLDPKKYQKNDLMRKWVFESLVIRRLQKEMELGDADRIVAVLRDDTPFGSDYTKVAIVNSVGYAPITPPKVDFKAGDIVHDGTYGDALSSKVVFVRAQHAEDAPFEQVTFTPGEAGGVGPDGKPFSRTIWPPKVTTDIVDTVAHELTHTLPRAFFSNHEMVRDCGFNYHNAGTNDAFGERLDFGGDPSQRRREARRHPIMGASTSEETWITQCTYAHLIAAMRHKPDPDLLEIDALLTREQNALAAEFLPGYSRSGTTQAASRTTRGWSLRLRDRAGRVLSTYPFEPQWSTGEGRKRDAVSVALRVPDDRRAASMEIALGTKVIAQQPISEAPPTLTVASPAADATVSGGTVHVAWSAASAKGKPLLASVLYAAGGAPVFTARVFESQSSAADVALDPAAKDHAIKIVVTDGTRSAERLIRFHSP